MRQARQMQSYRVYVEMRLLTDLSVISSRRDRTVENLTRTRRRIISWILFLFVIKNEKNQIKRITSACFVCLPTIFDRLMETIMVSVIRKNVTKRRDG